MWHFERAPEPTDIYWENLGTSTVKRFLKTGISYILSFFTLLIGFAIISAFKAVQIAKMLEYESDENEYDAYEQKIM